MLATSEVDVCGPCWTAPFHSVVAHAHRIPQLSDGHVVLSDQPKSCGFHVGVSIAMGVPQKSMVYKGTSHRNRWFGGTPILGNHHIVVDGCYSLLLLGCHRPSRQSQHSQLFNETWVLHLWKSNSTYFNIIIFLKWKAVETSWNILNHLETILKPSWNRFRYQSVWFCLRGHGFPWLPSLWIILLEGSKCTLQQGRGLIKVLLVHLHDAQVPKVLWVSST